MTMEQLQAICASVKIPVVAIGGICLDNIEKLQGSGAAGAAIVSGILQQKILKGLPEPFVKNGTYYLDDAKWLQLGCPS